MKFDSNFLKNPLNSYMVIIFILIGGGGYAFWDFIYTPLQGQLTEVEGRLNRATTELQKINSRVKEMASIEAQLEEQQAELLILRNMFPDEEVVTSRLRDLHRAFRASGVEIVRFTPEEKKAPPPAPTPENGKKRNKNAQEENDDPRQYYNENFYSIEVLGGYHMIGQMFAEIANFPYPTLISDLSANKNPQIQKEIELSESQGWTPYTISLKFTLTTFTSRK